MTLVREGCYEETRTGLRPGGLLLPGNGEQRRRDASTLQEDRYAPSLLAA